MCEPDTSHLNSTLYSMNVSKLSHRNKPWIYLRPGLTSGNMRENPILTNGISLPMDHFLQSIRTKIPILTPNLTRTLTPALRVTTNSETIVSPEIHPCYFVIQMLRKRGKKLARPNGLLGRKRLKACTKWKKPNLQPKLVRPRDLRGSASIPTPSISKTKTTSLFLRLLRTKKMWTNLAET